MYNFTVVNPINSIYFYNFDYSEKMEMKNFPQIFFLILIVVRNVNTECHIKMTCHG